MINLPRLSEASVKLPKVPTSPKVKDNHGKLFHDAMKTAYAMQGKNDKEGAKQALLAAKMNCDAMSMKTMKEYEAEYKAFMQLAKKYKITEAEEKPKKELTADEKKDLLKDFASWSGGFRPNECTWNKILKYMNSSMDGGIDIWAATKFMKAEMNKEDVKEGKTEAEFHEREGMMSRLEGYFGSMDTLHKLSTADMKKIYLTLIDQGQIKEHHLATVKEATDLDRARVAKAALDSSRKVSSFRAKVKDSTLSQHDEHAVLAQLKGFAGDNVLTKADIRKISTDSKVNYHELLGLANLDD